MIKITSSRIAYAAGWDFGAGGKATVKGIVAF